MRTASRRTAQRPDHEGTVVSLSHHLVAAPPPRRAAMTPEVEARSPGTCALRTLLPLGIGLVESIPYVGLMATPIAQGSDDRVSWHGLRCRPRSATTVRRSDRRFVEGAVALNHNRHLLILAHTNDDLRQRTSTPRCAPMSPFPAQQTGGALGFRQSVVSEASGGPSMPSQLGLATTRTPQRSLSLSMTTSTTFDPRAGWD